jgi:hypothetical protein
MNIRHMLTALICFMMIILMALSLSMCQRASAQTTYIDCSKEIQDCKDIQNAAHQIAEHMRMLGYNENEQAIRCMGEFWQEAQEDINGYYKLQTYTTYELQILTNAIYCESGHTENALRLDVGSVIINRVNDSRFPDTIYDVLTQKGQYSRWYVTQDCTNWCKQQDSYYKTDYYSMCENAAKQILMGNTTLDNKTVWQANFKQGSNITKYYPKYNMYFCS